MKNDLKEFKNMIKSWSFDELRDQLFFLNMNEGLAYFRSEKYLKEIEKELKKRKKHNKKKEIQM